VAFTTLLALPAPLLSVYLIDQVVSNGQARALNVTCGALALATALGLGLSLLQRYLLLVFARRVFFDLEMRLFQKVHTLPIAFFKRRGSGYIATRISDDVRQLGSLMAGTYIEGVSSLALLAAGLWVMLALHPALTAAVLAVSPGFVWVNLAFGRRAQAQSEALQERRGIVNATRLESLDAAHVARAFERGKLEARRLAGELQKEARVGLRRNVTVASAGALQMLLYNAGGLFLLWYGAYEVMTGRLTLGQFVAFNALLAYVYGPMSQLSGLYVGFRQGLGVLKRVVEVLDMPPEAGRGRGVGSIRAGEVVFEGVRFGYEAHHSVLNGVSFTLEPGQVTAVVGPTGAGKTTLIHLILRFYDPVSGRILIDGEDLRAFDVRALRRGIGAVEQDIRLFSGTVRENIAYGRPGATEEVVEEAAEAMNCGEFLRRFPKGLDTRVGAGGVQLSGGQRQRVALARAVVLNPKVLILDEATSSLDTRSEGLIQDALKRASAGRTTLLITHRLTAASIADRVLVLVGGRIAEEGTFQELLSRDGDFRAYYQKGLVGYENSSKRGVAGGRGPGGRDDASARPGGCPDPGADGRRAGGGGRDAPDACGMDAHG